jgi:hypothetical protein
MSSSVKEMEEQVKAAMDEQRLPMLLNTSELLHAIVVHKSIQFSDKDRTGIVKLLILISQGESVFGLGDRGDRKY